MRILEMRMFEIHNDKIKKFSTDDRTSFACPLIPKKWGLSFIFLFSLIISLLGQSYTYLELSSKNQKQIANARKNIEKSIDQEKILSGKANNASENAEKLIPLYRERIGNYRTIYETYSSHIYKFLTKFKGDPEEISVAVDLSSQARDIYIAAQNELNEHERVQDATGKLRILKSALEKFIQATELIEKAYEIYRTTPLESDDQTKMKNKKRNDSLQNVIRNQVILDPTNTRKQEITTTDKSTSQLYLNKLALSQSVNSDHYPQENVDNTTNYSESITEEDVAKENRPSPAVTSFNRSIGRYWVQIAACRVPLSKWQLAELVSDTLKVVETLIDYWYKYRVEPFDYEQANQFRIRCGIKGTFIVKE